MNNDAMVSLRLPTELIEKIEYMAEAQRRSRSQMIRLLIQQAIEAAKDGDDVSSS